MVFFIYPVGANHTGRNPFVKVSEGHIPDNASERISSLFFATFDESFSN